MIIWHNILVHIIFKAYGDFLRIPPFYFLIYAFFHSLVLGNCVKYHLTVFFWISKLKMGSIKQKNGWAVSMINIFRITVKQK